MRPLLEDRIAYLPGSYLRAMTAILQQSGIDFIEECRDRGLQFLEYVDSPCGVPRALHEQIERCFVELTEHRPDLWIALGQQLRLTAYGLMGLAYLTSPTVSESMAVCTEFRGLVISLSTQRHMLQDGNATLCWDLSSVPSDLRDFTVARDMATSLACLNDLWTGPFPHSQMVIAPAQEGLIDALRALDVPLQVSDSTTCLLWEHEHSARPLFNGDESLHRYYLDECRKLRRTRAENPFVDRVARAVEATLVVAPQDLSLERVARVLGVSERTLQRRLGEEDLSFRAVCDETRRRLAESLVDRQEVSVADIAFQLGYSEPASFLHAFRRWNGMSPGRFRRERGAAGRPVEAL